MRCGGRAMYMKQYKLETSSSTLCRISRGEPESVKTNHTLARQKSPTNEKSSALNPKYLR